MANPFGAPLPHGRPPWGRQVLWGRALHRLEAAWRGHCCCSLVWGLAGEGVQLTRACMSYMVLRWSQMTLDGTCLPMFWLNLSLIQIMWKCRFTPAGERGQGSVGYRGTKGRGGQGRHQWGRGKDGAGLGMQRGQVQEVAGVEVRRGSCRRCRR